jgi:hypothetical protein
MVVAELKRKGKKPTPEQQEWLDAFRFLEYEAPLWVDVYIWTTATPVDVIDEVLR